MWDNISTNFVEGLPKSCSIDAVLIIVDLFSKYARFIGLKHMFSTKDMADKFVLEIVWLHGIPFSIIFDWGSNFMSAFWVELYTLYGTKLKCSSAYHLETKGQMKVVKKSLECYLQCFANDHPCQWINWLYWAELSYDTTHHFNLNMSPFHMVYVHDQPTIPHYGKLATIVHDLDELLMKWD